MAAARPLGARRLHDRVARHDVARRSAEVRVLGSFLAYRLEQATGRPADPALVKQLTLELYLSPSRTPRLTGGLPLGRPARRWLFRGALGKDTRKAAGKALDAAERLDVATLEARWRSR